MGKQTKRQRKFRATGGVHARIEKGGTVTKHGKVRHRQHKNKNNHPSSSTHKQQDNDHSNQTKESDFRSNDFISGSKNLGDLDMDSFFAQFSSSEQAAPVIDEADAADNGRREPSALLDGNDKQAEEASSSSSSESDDDDDGTSSSESSSASEKKNSNENESTGDKLKTMTSKKSATAVDTPSSSSDSDSSSSDEEDDVKVAEAKMREEMSKMKRSDPEFHDFLKENEESLLDFGQDDDSDDDDDEEEEDAIANDNNKNEMDKTQPPGTKNGAIQLTPLLLSKLTKGTFESHGIKSLKKLVGAYRSACHLADADNEDDGGRKFRPGETAQTYVMESSKLFDELMVLCLDRLHRAFEYHLLGEDGDNDRHGEGKAENFDEDNKKNEKENAEDTNNKPLHPKTLEKAARWSELRPILMSFFRSTMHVLEEAKEPELLAFVLKALSKYLRFLTPFPRLAESMLKVLTSLWSAPLDSSEDYQLVRLNAFFRIRQLALTQPFPFIEDILKKTYLAYARRAKFGSSVASSLPTITFMGNCLVELYSLDYHSSYQHAFVYIRQLALLLRSAMQKKTTEAMQQVYCWQYMLCLKLWVAVLSSAAPNDDGTLMRSLIYPLTEVIFGTVRLVPSPVRHMPLRFLCVRLLQQLAAAAGVFIPTTSVLLDCLEWKEWYLPDKKSKTHAKRSGGGGLQLHLMLKLGKDDPLRSHEQLQAGITELFVLLQREVELYRYSAGFPEFAIRIVVMARKFVKDVRNPHWKAHARALIEICDKYSEFCKQGRAQLQEAPMDVKLLECLKPVSAPSMRERHEASIAKEQKDRNAAVGITKTSQHKETGDMKDQNNDDNSGEEDMTEKSKPTKQKKRKRTAKNKQGTEEPLPKKLLAETELMEARDQVQEGVDWSDDED